MVAQYHVSFIGISLSQIVSTSSLRIPSYYFINYPILWVYALTVKRCQGSSWRIVWSACKGKGCHLWPALAIIPLSFQPPWTINALGKRLRLFMMITCKPQNLISAVLAVLSPWCVEDILLFHTILKRSFFVWWKVFTYSIRRILNPSEIYPS